MEKIPDFLPGNPAFVCDLRGFAVSTGNGVPGWLGKSGICNSVDRIFVLVMGLQILQGMNEILINALTCENKHMEHITAISFDSASE